MLHSTRHPGVDQATVTIADVLQSNGVIHVVDKVLLPKQPPAHAW